MPAFRSFKSHSIASYRIKSHRANANDRCGELIDASMTLRGLPAPRLTKSPRPFRDSAGLAASLMLRAAFKSLSITKPQKWHIYVLSDKSKRGHSSSFLNRVTFDRRVAGGAEGPAGHGDFGHIAK